MKQQKNLDRAPFHCPPTCVHAVTSLFPCSPPRLRGTWHLPSPHATRRNSFDHEGGQKAPAPRHFLGPEALRGLSAPGSPGEKRKGQWSAPVGRVMGALSFLQATGGCPGPRQDSASLLLTARGKVRPEEGPGCWAQHGRCDQGQSSVSCQVSAWLTPAAPVTQLLLPRAVAGSTDRPTFWKRLADPEQIQGSSPPVPSLPVMSPPLPPVSLSLPL